MISKYNCFFGVYNGKKAIALTKIIIIILFIIIYIIIITNSK